MAFQPQVDQTFRIGSQVYRIAPHPAASWTWMPYGQEGRTAIVYQLISEEGEKVALKVFKMRFRQPSLVGLSHKLAPFARLPGLRVCERTVLTPSEHGDLLSAEPDLAYAVLMPWIDGPTWMDILGEQRVLDADESLDLAEAFITILQAMEGAGVAHCDLSAPNVILPMLAGGTGMELVDVEGLYAPGLSKPEATLGGTPGYNHRRIGGGAWGPLADRFAGSVLLAEMLGWFSPEVREASWGESFFDPQEMQTDGPRYQLLLRTLQSQWGQGVVELFARAWFSPSLEACPSPGEWAQAIASIRAGAAAQPAPASFDTGPETSAAAPPAETTAVWEVVDDDLFPGATESVPSPPPSPAPPPPEPVSAPAPVASSDPTEILEGARDRALGIIWMALYLLNWSLVVSVTPWNVRAHSFYVVFTQGRSICTYISSLREQELLGIVAGGLAASLLAWATQWAYFTLAGVQDAMKAKWWGGANLLGWAGWLLTWGILDTVWGDRYAYGEWVFMMAIGGFVGGVLAGMVQWLLIRKRAERAWGWIILSAFSWAVWMGSLAYYDKWAAVAMPLVAGFFTWLGMRGLLKSVLAAPQPGTFLQAPAAGPAAAASAPATFPAVSPSPPPAMTSPPTAAAVSGAVASQAAWTPPTESAPLPEESGPVASDLPVRGWHSLGIDVPDEAGGRTDNEEDDFIEFDDSYADGW